MFYKKRCSLKFSHRPSRKCFPVNFVKFLRITKVTASQIEKIFNFQRITAFCLKHVTLQIIQISFTSNGDWKESIRQRNVSFARLKFAEWRFALMLCNCRTHDFGSYYCMTGHICCYTISSLVKKRLWPFQWTTQASGQGCP